jgi:hypothetical protein
LEREYEAWIVREIEDYLNRANLKYFTWAVSPKEELTYPADECVFFNGKIIGLQFKKIKYFQRKKQK